MMEICGFSRCRSVSHRVPDEYRICITDIFVVDDVELEKYGWGTIKTDDKPVYYLMLSYTFENKMPETEVNKNYYKGTTETLSDAYVNRWRGSSGASGGRIQAGTIEKGHIHIEIDDDTVKSLEDVRSIIFQ